MVTIHYPTQLPYRSIPNAGAQPAVEIELINGDRSVRAVGILDSGSMHSVFSRDIAALIGIGDVTTGRLVRVTTLGGPFEFYQFDLTVRFPGIGASFSGQIGFSPAHTPRNILGRILVFSGFVIGFREAQQRVYLRTEG